MKIKFRAANKTVYNIRQKPIPASQLVPQWWKNMNNTVNNEGIKPSPFPSLTAKKCFPLLDAITAGYIVPLWADIYVEQRNNEPYVHWAVDQNVFEAWPWDQSSGYEIPEGYSQTVFKYVHGWIIETPKDYSCLIIHPIGYPNLPFRTLSGVVDTDLFKAFANSPLVIKKGFEGIIEKGTPMFQVIPIKRDQWKLETDYLDDEETRIRVQQLQTTMIASYAKFFRKNKKYE